MVTVVLGWWVFVACGPSETDSHDGSSQDIGALDVLEAGNQVDAGSLDQVDVACQPGSGRCDEGGAEHSTCLDDGTWGAPEPCPEGTTCADGRCSCEACSILVGNKCLPVGPTSCPDGWLRNEDCGCEPVIIECAANELATFDGACEPIGPACGDGWALQDGACRPIYDEIEGAAIPLTGGGSLPIGAMDDCGEGPWPSLSGSQGAPLLYVLEGASPDTADGSMDAPFPSISQALDAAVPGTVIAVGAPDEGATYLDTLLVTTSVAVIGRCSDLVTISPPSPQALTPGGAIIETVDGVDDVHLEGLTLTGSGRGIYLVGGQGALIRSLSLLDLGDLGILAAYVSDLTIEGTSISSTWPSSGVEIDYSDGVSITSVAISDAGEAGIFVHGSTGVTVTTSKVVGTRDNGDFTYIGGGIVVSMGSSASLEGVHLLDNGATGVLVYESDAAITDSTITDVLDEGTTMGDCIAVISGGATVSRTVVSWCDRAGVYDDTAEVALDDVIVQGANGAHDWVFGAGVMVRGGGSLEAEGLLLEHVVGSSFGVAKGDASIEEVIITAGEGVVGEHGPVGLNVGQEASLSAARLVILEDFVVGVYAQGAIDLEDVTVSNPRIGYDGHAGEGILAAGATTLVDVYVTGAHHAGITVSETDEPHLERLVVDGTTMNAYSQFCFGIVLGGVTGGSLESSVVRGNAGMGIALYQSSALVLSDVTISSTVPKDDDLWGYGLYAQMSDFTLATSVIVDSHNSGLGLAYSTGEVSASRIVRVHGAGGLWMTGTVKEILDGLADGVSVVGPSVSLSLDGCEIGYAERAGILFEPTAACGPACAVELTSCLVHHSEYGYALNGDATMAMEGTVFLDNGTLEPAGQLKVDNSIKITPEL